MVVAWQTVPRASVGAGRARDDFRLSLLSSTKIGTSSSADSISWHPLATPGLRALMIRGGAARSGMDTEYLSFTIIPRLNAPGAYRPCPLQLGSAHDDR